jgi:hypothetical protein
MRCFEPVDPESAKAYIGKIRLMLGFKVRHSKNPIPLEELRLHHIFPLVLEEELDSLNYKQKKSFWRGKQLELESFIAESFKFMETHNSAKSPRTHTGRLTALQRLGHMLYRHEVTNADEYNTIPIFATLNRQIEIATQKIQEWQVSRTYVANQERKWPPIVEGETALTTLRRTVVEPLRLECRPRRKNGSLRKGHVIAYSHQKYLKWGLMTERPARRQKDYRTMRIALCCPVIRPSEVPVDGFWFPLPCPADRDKRSNGRLGDNYLYHTYFYKGKYYPTGVWIMEIAAYKTDKTYGTFSMKLPNRQFNDGTCFYDYIEHYLWGWWLSRRKKKALTYDWYDPKLIGQKGQWITKGWMEFEAETYCPPGESESCTLRWSYLLPVPKLGKLADGNSFNSSFTRTSYQAIGKRITPHMIRYMWATWGIQMNLSDRRLRSLAYALGHSVETLRKVYERCTPDEKLRPIEEVIDDLLLQDSMVTPEGEVSKVFRLVEDFKNLSPYEQEQFNKLRGMN